MEWSVGKGAPWGLVLVANPVLLGLGAILVLPLARMPLLKLYWQHGTSVLPSCVVIWPICTGMVPDLLFWAVLVLWPIWDHRSIQQRQLCKHQFFLASHQLAGSKMVLSRDHVVQKRWSCEVVGSHHCLFDISRPVVYLPSSMPANIPLLKVVLATWHKCFSKLCLSSVPFGPTSLQQVRLHKINNFGTATKVDITRWLRNTCFQAVPWNALIRKENCFQMTQFNIWVAFELRMLHHSMSPEVPLQFVKVLRWLDQWY